MVPVAYFCALLVIVSPSDSMRVGSIPTLLRELGSLVASIPAKSIAKMISLFQLIVLSQLNPDSIAVTLSSIAVRH